MRVSQFDEYAPVREDVNVRRNGVKRIGRLSVLFSNLFQNTFSMTWELETKLWVISIRNFSEKFAIFVPRREETTLF